MKKIGSNLKCSFCNKPQNKVKKLIAGPIIGEQHVCICDECVEVSYEIMEDEEIFTYEPQDDVIDNLTSLESELTEEKAKIIEEALNYIQKLECMLSVYDWKVITDDEGSLPDIPVRVSVSLKIESDDDFPNYDVSYGIYENGEWHIEGNYKNYTVLAWTSQMIPFIPEQ